MNSSVEEGGIVGHSTGFARVKDLISLTKPRVTSMVLATEGAGMWMSPGHIGRQGIALTLIGTLLIVGSANALNMWWERDSDGFMSRTKDRPLPAGRMDPNAALVFGILLGALGIPLLFAVNALLGVLGLIALLCYVLVYTPMKRVSYLALLVGAIPGALPPLMGWVSVTGTLGIGGVLLFAVMFVWQIPHFAAITLFRREDYARAGLQVVSVEKGEVATRRMIVGYTVLLVLVTLLFMPFKVAGWKYESIALVIGAAFLALGASGVDGRGGIPHAKKVFGYSIVYLLVLLSSLLLDRQVV